jgi:uncharacterized alkaline shock family protein YloU
MNMLTIENHIGKITVSTKYLTDLIWNTVTGCFGVADMNTVSMLSDIRSALRLDKMNRNGVGIKVKKNKIFISLHVSVTLGTNISAVTGSLKHRVRYAVEQATGMDVAGINVFVDSITE